MRASGVWIAAVLVMALPQAHAQSVRSLIRNGNSLYTTEKFSDAEVSYRKALEKENALVQGHFNLGDALHKQGKYDESIKEYEAALSKAEQGETRAHAEYNIGNSLMREQKYQDAIQSYVEALKTNPGDEDAKYNLSYALEKLRQQQQQNKNQSKNQNKDQDKKDQDKKNQQNQDQQQKQQKQPQAQQQKQMSRNEAERILDVLKNSEKDVQRKLRVRQAVRPKTDKDW